MVNLNCVVTVKLVPWYISLVDDKNLESDIFNPAAGQNFAGIKNLPCRNYFSAERFVQRTSLYSIVSPSLIDPLRASIFQSALLRSRSTLL